MLLKDAVTSIYQKVSQSFDIYEFPHNYKYTNMPLPWLPLTSVSKRVLAKNLSNENEWHMKMDSF